MIALHSNCLVFRLANGESIPCSAEMICFEIIGGADLQIDPEMLRHAAASVFHYFKHDLERDTVTVGEFAGALERVLRNLGLTLYPAAREGEREVIESDLNLLARELDVSLELYFFPRLRDELRFQIRQSPRLLRFRGLRGCVKRLTHARRWSARCDALQEQIVEYLRQCLTAESCACPLVVE
ncbi:MAG: hypothetical protein ACREE6_08750 [Limisphaerales bacterium]